MKREQKCTYIESSLIKSMVITLVPVIVIDRSHP
jgi:hypothetical protein